VKLHSCVLQESCKVAQLAATLDPEVQASQAQALHLELMKWRAAPALDLPAIARKRCLLLGAPPPAIFCTMCHSHMCS
jgi:hypothetical protein